MKQNYWKKTDIRITHDSQGFFEADHKYQGMLYDWTPFATRQEARQAAVRELEIKKEEES